MVTFHLITFMKIKNYRFFGRITNILIGNTPAQCHYWTVPNDVIIKLVMGVNTLTERLDSAHKIHKIEGKLKKYPSTNGVQTNTALKI